MIQEAKGLIMQDSLFPSIPVSLSLSPFLPLPVPSASTLLYISPSFFLSTVFAPDLSSFGVKSLT